MTDSLRADWIEVGTKESLERDIGNGFRVQLGWTEGEDSTDFCEKLPDGSIKMLHWDWSGVRAQIAALLGAPVHTFKERK